ncbi:MAG TPA: YegS/Rv2252/BmrU family lipid kinase, partial [Actinospica sp.]|nr:YegS/Rv2252/BmrU family lipid kinase [Actinospica sp.]
AAVALYGAVAVLFYISTRRRASWLFLLMPLAVGGARLYRGMHHPSDVVAGALLGTLVLLVARRVVLPSSERGAAESAPSSAGRPEPARRSGGAVLIVNSLKADAAAAQRLLSTFGEHCSRTGRPAPRLELTTPEEHGAGLARAAVASGAGLVVACGGDGTVHEVASALVGTGVALGVIPLGTGNLLAANLGIPADVDDAIAVLATTSGADRQIDVGLLDGRTTFLGMAGIGLDAVMIEAVPEKVKERAGWAAYAVAVARHLADRISTVTVEVDGRRSRHRNVSMLLVGNIGRIQAGLKPMPDAEVDDGLLDLVVLAPDGPLGWLRAAARMKSSKMADRDGEVFRDRGRRITVRTTRQVPREADGETLPAAAGLRAEVCPGALTVRVPEARIPLPARGAAAESAAARTESRDEGEAGTGRKKSRESKVLR